LFFSEFSLQHGVTSSSRIVSGKQYGEHPAGQQ